MKETNGEKVLNQLGLIDRRPDSAAIAELMQELLRGDDVEQRETFEFLKKALDEDRPEGYKLFPRA